MTSRVSKAIMGEVWLKAMEELGMDRGEELDRGLAALTDQEYGTLRCYVGGLPARRTTCPVIS